MSRRSDIPRYAMEQLRTIGLGGRQIWIPPSPTDPPVLVALLQRAEDRVYVTRDARRARLLGGFRTIREEASVAGISVAHMHKQVNKACAEIAAWWRSGERDRVDRSWKLGGVDGYRAYQRYRLQVVEKRHMWDARPDLVDLAVESVRTAWWRHRYASANEWRLAEEVAYLGVLARDGADVTLEAKCAGARLGLPDGAWHLLREGAIRGVRRSLEDLDGRPIRKRRVA